MGYNKDMIGRDVTQGIVWFSGKAKERQILTPELVQSLFAFDWNDNIAKLL
ncbi:MAG: hypothetical protein Ta2A_11480 [Treponemataceae bacterium]|nr:MAG: hypothetical protein Ta2A_11480 [Treponemataceae bacterium]